MDSSVSSKLDASAEVVTSVGETSVEGVTFVDGINGHSLRAQAANFASVASSDTNGRAFTSTYATTAYVDSSVSGKQDSSAMTAFVAKSAYDDLYSSYTALSGVISMYSGWFSELSSISAKVDNSAIGVIE